MGWPSDRSGSWGTKGPWEMLPGQATEWEVRSSKPGPFTGWKLSHPTALFFPRGSLKVELHVQA